MDWALAIERNRGALLRILSVLFAFIGLKEEATSVSPLSRMMRNSVLRLLRPAEAATRRLIVIEAEGIEVELGPTRQGGTGGAKRSRAGSSRGAVFPLFDPRRRSGPPKQKRRKGPEPQIRFLDGFDPAYEPYEPTAPASPDDLLDSTRLCQRLLALKAALEDLPKQARRLARVQLRRAENEKLRRITPLRGGRPPGHREKPTHEVDEILADCEILARHALKPPDTS